MNEQTVRTLIEMLEIIKQVNNANPLGAASIPDNRINQLIHELMSMPLI